MKRAIVGLVACLTVVTAGAIGAGCGGDSSSNASASGIPDDVRAEFNKACDEASNSIQSLLSAKGDPGELAAIVRKGCDAGLVCIEEKVKSSGVEIDVSDPSEAAQKVFTDCATTMQSAMQEDLTAWAKDAIG